jgi:hypothetical protein
MGGRRGGFIPGDTKLLAELAGVADRARHPALTLTSFLDDLAGLQGLDDDVDDEDISEAQLLAAGASPAQLHAATLRRAAVIWAANQAVTATLADLAELTWHPDTGLPVTAPGLVRGSCGGTSRPATGPPTPATSTSGSRSAR